MADLYGENTQALAEDTLDTVDTEGNDEAVSNETHEGSEQAQEGEQQRLYAGKYKSVEELEKAYTHMQQHGTKLAQELSTMRQQQPQRGAPAAQQPSPQYGMPPNMNPALIQQLAPVLAPFMAPMMDQLQQQQEQLMQVQMQSEVARLRSTHQDFDEVAPVIPQLFQATPELFNLPNPVETAYLLAKSQVAQENMKKVYDDAQKAAYDSKAAKQQAVTEGQQGKFGKKVSPEEAIAQEILGAATKGGSIF